MLTLVLGTTTVDEPQERSQPADDQSRPAKPRANRQIEVEDEGLEDFEAEGDLNGVAYQPLPKDYEGNWENLQTLDGYLDEVRKLLKVGIERAGRFGVSCPRCWRPVSYNGPADDGFGCACTDMDHPTLAETQFTMGFSALRSTIKDHAGAI